MKKGISLVALVVTIIVLIILTGTVIATFMEGGIIDKAKEAVMKSDCVTLQEAYNMAYNTAKIDEVTGTGEPINKVEILEKAVKNVGLDLNDFIFDIANEEVEYTGDNTEIEEWINQNFKYNDLVNAGYIFSILDGEVYMTGIDFEIGFRGATKETVGDLKNSLGDGYEIKNAQGQIADDEELVTTGCVVMKDGEEYATIVIKGDTKLDGRVNVNNSSQISVVIQNGIEGAMEKGMSIAQILACDVNSDGIISSDDAGFVHLDYIGLSQKVKIEKMPEIMKGYKYTWYSYEELLAKISAEYLIEDDENINIPKGMTYLQLEKEVKRLLGTNSANIYDVTNKNDVIEDGAGIEFEFSQKISETEFTQENGISLIAVVNE